MRNILMQCVLRVSGVGLELSKRGPITRSSRDCMGRSRGGGACCLVGGRKGALQHIVLTPKGRKYLFRGAVGSSIGACLAGSQRSWRCGRVRGRVAVRGWKGRVRCLGRGGVFYLGGGRVFYLMGGRVFYLMGGRVFCLRRGRVFCLTVGRVFYQRIRAAGAETSRAVLSMVGTRRATMLSAPRRLCQP